MRGKVGASGGAQSQGSRVVLTAKQEKEPGRPGSVALLAWEQRRETTRESIVGALSVRGDVKTLAFFGLAQTQTDCRLDEIKRNQ